MSRGPSFAGLPAGSTRGRSRGRILDNARRTAARQKGRPNTGRPTAASTAIAANSTHR
ncbi:hypothetical protein ACFPM0_07925 [Pseudonocardia sulfidoxydans]|uniref:hypothetical protein n=1 Tax=Pseudonocardia sulfidoxydans TaxID=54011 RepID=UPI003617F4F5